MSQQEQEADPCYEQLLLEGETGMTVVEGKSGDIKFYKGRDRNEETMVECWKVKQLGRDHYF